MRTMIYYYRRHADLTQGDLAKKAGYSRQTINGLENRKIKYPKHDTLDAVARALGVRIEDIYKDGSYRYGGLLR